MNRYERIIKRLDSIPAQDRRLCPVKTSCVCTGCAVAVGAKRITERELTLYLEGTMQKIIQYKDEDDGS